MDDPAAHDQGELDRLQRFLTRPGIDFGLALAMFADPAAARRLRAEAIERAAAAGCRVSSLHLGHDHLTTDMLEGLEQSLAGAEAVFVTGLDELLADTLGHERRAPALVNLNMRRDQLPEQIRGRVVLWVSRRGYPLLAKLAWDLLEVTLTRFEFVSVDPLAIEPLRVVPDIRWFEFVEPDQVAEKLGHAEAWARRSESLADLAGAADAASVAATLYVSAGALDRGADMLERAIGLYERIPDVAEMVRQLGRLAGLHRFEGKLEQALAEAERAADAARELGASSLELDALQLIADIHRSRAEISASIEVLEHIIEICEQRGEQRQLAIALAKQGVLARREDALERAAGIFAELGDEPSWASSRVSLADLLLFRGQLDAAEDIYLGEALPVWERQGDMRELAVMRGRIARLRAAQGQLELALQILRDEELPAYARLGDRLSALGTMLMIAQLEAQRGELRAAASELRDHVLPGAQSLGHRRFELYARLQLAHVLELDGQADDAVAQYDEAHALATQLGIDLGDDLQHALDRLRG